MKLPKNYFTNLTASKYREYLKILPSMQKENTRIITTLIFTFFALSFFGIFAIRPTITTIVELRRKLADNQLVYDALQTKIQNLSLLQQQYNQLGSDLPFVLEAVPDNPHVPQLISQVLGLARQKNINITSLETTSVTVAEHETLANPAQSPELPAGPDEIVPEETIGKTENKNSYTFTLQAQGTYDALLDYTESLSKIQRIIKIESISINSGQNNGTLALDIEARVYFQR